MVRIAKARQKTRRRRQKRCLDGDSELIECRRAALAARHNQIARLSAVYNEDDFDFALVLPRGGVYAYWADRLDFWAGTLGIDDDDDNAEEDDLMGGGNSGSAVEPGREHGGNDLVRAS